MRYRSTLLLRKAGLGALAALFLALGTGAAQAQLPVFDGVDWLMDRGNVTFTAVPVSGIPQRPGTNNFNNVANNPGHAVRRFLFPRTFDLTGAAGNTTSLIVDNVNAADPANSQDTNGHIVRTLPAYSPQTGLNPQLMAHTALTAGWTLPLVAADGTVNDYRAPGLGYSVTADFTQTYSFDYAFTLATHNDFLVTDDSGNTRPATDAELAALPYVSSNIYSGIQNTLTADAHPIATYTSGGLNLSPGSYNIDIYSPGDGTKIGGVVHPNVTRALVRVSWFNTVDVNGNIVKANTEDPVHSRIYEVDLGQSGWIHIQGGGSNQAVFPYDGNPANQIAVTIYSITPDTYTGANDPNFAAAPLITADAVRFVGYPTTTSPGLGPIAAHGKILGPVVSSNKIVRTANNLAIIDTQPLTFFAREESIPDPNATIPTDPTQPVSATNPLIPDPTATVSVPVFYCIDSQNDNNVGVDTDGFLPSIGRVRWRYVGIADGGTSNGTSAASPMLANVRCRDGQTRTMVYFLTTNVAGTLGHIYAFDAAGDRPTQTTQNYWIYPSYRPLTVAETAGGKLPAQYHDPNYKSFNQGAYPAAAWGADVANPFFHYDGEIVKNPANAGEFIVRSDTQLPAFGGILGSPVIIDDPSNPAGPQILVVPNINGRVYAFDAGGRGDFNPLDITSTGTTQRNWTWPHFGADAYYANNLTGTNRIADETSLGTILGSLVFDTDYNAANLLVKPIMVPGGDGRLYAINAPQDAVPSYVAATGRATWVDRRNWVYPALDKLGGLGAAISTPSVFKPNGATFPFIYFTCGGRAYALQENPAVNGPTFPTVNTLKWVFPNTPNAPASDPNDANTDPLDPGFFGNAPVLISATALNAMPAFVGSPLVNNDYCYVLQGDGGLYGLNAFNGTLLASGATLSGVATESSPIASLLTGLVTDAATIDATTNPQPAIIFSDDQGVIYGLAARPDTGFTGPFGGAYLGQVWHHQDTASSRVAAASLAGGYIFQGDTGGQLHAYGVGTGPNGLGETVAPNEPAELVSGIGDLSIDIRNVNVYSKADFDAAAKTGATRSALYQTNGTKFGSTADPIRGNVGDNTITGAYYTDWGEYIYVMASGVYHAQPQDDPANPKNAAGPPSITVYFTLSHNGTNITKQATVPVTTAAVHGNGSLWPDDPSLTGAEHDTLSILGNDTALGDNVVLTGRNQNVYAWTAKFAFMVDPESRNTSTVGPNNVASTGSLTYQPRGGYRVSAYAVIQQPNLTQEVSSTLYAGQPDYQGASTAAGGLPIAVRGRTPQRDIGITNPLAVTTRGLTNLTDMTGPNNPNVIGLFPSINSPGPKPVNVGELLGNGNRQNSRGSGVALGGIKSLFAPLPMVSDGSTSNYKAIDNLGNSRDAFYIVDRSNIHNALGRNLQVQVTPKPIQWHGWAPSSNPTATGSSVMNALPWELLPSDGQPTVDYPSIPATAISITKNTGESAISSRVPLLPPTNVGTDPATRSLVATPFALQVKVPRFQPANVNYGVHTFGGVTFGSSYLNSASVNRGDPSAGNTYDRNILGPLITNTGDQAPLGSGPAYPAGGYVSNFDVAIVTTSTTTTTGTTLTITTTQGGTFSARGAFGGTAQTNQAGNNNTDTLTTYRHVEMGISVPPSIKVRIAEPTLDMGKVPHGTGYTPLTNQSDARSFQVPFAPDMTPGLPGPFYWDDATRGGEFFRPFTVFNESNVNLVDVRVAKLLGQNFSQIDGQTLSQYTDITAGLENNAHAVSLMFHSDQVNSQSIAPLPAVPFKNVSGALGVGNAGLISSFDHQSSSSNSVSSLYPERPLWPVANTFVTAADITVANQQYGAMLPTTNTPAAGVLGWADGLQPQPTIGKPRPGDTQGRTATVPDQPYSGNANFQRPRVALAIPVGTPVGTYSAPIYAYEDNTPIQWQEWLSHYGKPATVSQNYPVSHDGILNVTANGAPSEGRSDPSSILKVTVREAKLSRDPTTGDLSMLDLFGSWNDTTHGYFTPPGADNFPAAYLAPGAGANVFNRNLFLYFGTQRRQSPDAYIGANGLPKSYAPFTLAYSYMPAPYSQVGGTNIVVGDFDFQNKQGLSGAGGPLSTWWQQPAFTQYDNTTIYDLFPSAPSGSNPFLPGTANSDTMRLLHPAIASAVNYSAGYGNLNVNDSEAYMVVQGQVDKSTAANSGQFHQTRDSRVLIQGLNGATPGVPSGPVYSMPNDPGLTKLAPKPLLVKLPAANGAPAQKFFYVFYHAGNQSNTAIYYNAMYSTSLNTPFATNNTQWLVDAAGKPLADAVLPTSGALVWQSDPAPVYRHIKDPYGSGQTIDVVDVVYTGVLKGRQTVETLLSRYKINRVAPVNATDPPLGSLTLLPVRKVVGEVLTRVGNSNTYQAQDAAWELGTGPLGTFNPTVDTESQISIYRIPGGVNNASVLINAQAAPNQAKAQIGRYDQASGLLYYDSTLGGQIVVDMRSGTIRFPQVAPALADRIQISYIPFVMRLNTSRDDTNIDRTLATNYGSLAGAPAFKPTASITSSGNNTSPVVVFDRGSNPRALLTAPQVVFPGGATPTLDRMWVLYRKNDPSGVAKSTIYYKSMRLMVKLPFPVQLTVPNPTTGAQQIANLTVGGNLGPYEVDWVRGRIYFTEIDENSPITVNYRYYDPVTNASGASGNLSYRVAWGDEISASLQQGDQTTPEVALPTDSAVSEGQVSAFKDPFLDKLWIFWSSTRAGSTDLYYETIAPQFYPTASNQR